MGAAPESSARLSAHLSESRLIHTPRCAVRWQSALSQRLAQPPRNIQGTAPRRARRRTGGRVGRARAWPQTVPNCSRSPTTATAWTLPTCCRYCCVGEPVCPGTAVRSSTCGWVARYSVVMRGSVDPDSLGIDWRVGVISFSNRRPAGGAAVVMENSAPHSGCTFK